MKLSSGILSLLLSSLALSSTLGRKVRRQGHRRTTSSGKKGPSDCTRLELYSDNAIFQAEFNAIENIGGAVSDIPLMDLYTNEQVGLFTVLAIEVDPVNGKSFEDGYLALFQPGSTSDVTGSITYAGPTPVFADSTLGLGRGDFSITGGTGSYSCAEGIVEFKGFSDDFSQFKLDIVTCGDFCDPYSA
uniref:Dirigent protein n=1 Tax=Entomoneis paludosa TaxID=265537 RepID=A0A6U3APK6_9STRA|mmetsp:Transcript_25003/g.51985  ORF Transcript_25003/g.51985 Transcript_25003/m.51985 type:complete len:188 (+) Transcript_25003:247-810(+)